MVTIDRSGTKGNSAAKHFNRNNNDGMDNIAGTESSASYTPIVSNAKIPPEESFMPVSYMSCISFPTVRHSY